MNKCLFLDRDGIINEDIGYPGRPEDIRFTRDIFPLCKTAREKGYLLVVITNQAGVAKGHFGETEVRLLHQWMGKEFQKRGIRIEKFYYCPYHKDGTVQAYRKESDCRKPRPGMILQAVKDLQIDISTSLMIGDKLSDRIQLDGLKTLVVKSPYSGDEYDIERLLDAEKYL